MEGPDNSPTQPFWTEMEQNQKESAFPTRQPPVTPSHGQQGWPRGLGQLLAEEVT